MCGAGLTCQRGGIRVSFAMAPSRRKKASAAAAAAAAAQWKVGDLVLAKMKGFPAWPAMVPLLFAFFKVF